MKIQDLEQEELYLLLINYDEYVQNFYEEHDLGMTPVCVAEYYDNEFMLESEE